MALAGIPFLSPKLFRVSRFLRLFGSGEEGMCAHLLRRHPDRPSCMPCGSLVADALYRCDDCSGARARRLGSAVFAAVDGRVEAGVLAGSKPLVVG